MELFLIIALLIIAFAVVMFNQIIKLRNNREQAFSDIDVQLKLRYDLIPNLVQTVQGYATHEKEVLENVTKYRAQAMQSGSVDEKIESNNMLSSALKSLFAVAENYPDLKANKNFLDLQYQLSDIENKIAAARRFFNNATKEYNTSIQMFPNSILAMLFRFKSEPYFELEDAKEAKNVSIKV